jgi:hypothetical protein
MPKPPVKADRPSEWSGADERLLWYVALIVVSLFLIRGRETAGRWGRFKAGFKGFINSAAGVALLTIFLGGIAGQMITTSFAAYGEQLRQEREVTSNLFGLVGSCVAASQNLIDRKDQKFRTSTPEEQRKNDVIRDKFAEDYNAISTRWRSERVQITLAMAYYHSRHPLVLDAWRQTSDSLNKYMSCAREWNDASNIWYTSEQTESACVDKKVDLEKKLETMAAEMEKVRSVHWFTQALNNLLGKLLP